MLSTPHQPSAIRRRDVVRGLVGGGAMLALAPALDHPAAAHDHDRTLPQTITEAAHLLRTGQVPDPHFAHHVARRDRAAVRAPRHALNGRQVRKRMNLSLSCDHRVVDGWDAASFMQTLKGYIENPLRLLSA